MAVQSPGSALGTGLGFVALTLASFSSYKETNRVSMYIQVKC